MNFIKSLLLLPILFFCSSISSQNKVIDSLKLEIRNHKEKDTTHINLLYSLALSSFQSDLRLTLATLEEVVNLSDSLNYIKGKAKSSYLYGILENRKSNYDKSFELFAKSRAYYESINDKNGVAATYTAYGINYFDLAQYDKVLENFNKATVLFKEIGNQEELVASLNRVGNLYTSLGKYDEAIDQYKQLIAQKNLVDEQTLNMTYNNLGVVYRYQGKYPIAIEYYNKYMESRKKSHDTIAMAATLGNLGEIYTELEDYDKAMSYQKKSLNLSIQQNHKPNIANANIGIGNVYLNKKEYFKALKFLNKALEVSLEINNLDKVTFCYHNIGETYVHLNDLDVAREFFLKAIDVNEKIGYKLGLTHNYLGIAQTYIGQNDHATGLDYALKAAENGKELKSLEVEKKAGYLVSLAHEGLGNYKKALKTHQQYKELNDSLFSKENFEKIAQLEAEYKYKQQLDSASLRELKLTKTVQATSQDLEKTQRNYLLATIGVLLLTILLGAFVFYQKLKDARSKTQNAVMEQKLLRSQMTPHFIFNSLSVLQGMILNNEKKKSVNYLSKFSKLLRITLENSRDKTVSLNQELIAVQDYLSLQNLENDTYKYTMLVEDAIDVPRFEIPPMLIQPFVENAIEHAFTGYSDNNKIDIRLTFNDNQLICIIADNGIGVSSIKRDKNKDKCSLATTITTERLEVLSKTFKMKGSVSIEDKSKFGEQGTLVTLTIPYKLNEAE